MYNLFIKIHTSLSIFFMCIMFLIVCAFILNMVQSPSFGMFLFFLVYVLLALQPVLSIWYTRYTMRKGKINKFFFSSLRKWFAANTAFVFFFSLINIVALIYSMSNIEKQKELTQRLSELSDSLFSNSFVRSVLIIMLFFMSLFFLHTASSFFILKKTKSLAEDLSDNSSSSE